MCKIYELFPIREVFLQSTRFMIVQDPRDLKEFRELSAIKKVFLLSEGFSSIRSFSWNQILAILQKTELYFHTTCTLCRQLQRQASVARRERVIPPGSPAARLRQALSSRCVSDASPLARHRSYHPPSHSAPAAGIVIVSRQ